MEEVAAVDLAFGDLGAEVVGFADDGAGVDAGTGEGDRPGFAPVVAAVEVVDVRGAAEFREDDDERVFEQSALGEVIDQGGEGAVERTDLLEAALPRFAAEVRP